MSTAPPATNPAPKATTPAAAPAASEPRAALPETNAGVTLRVDSDVPGAQVFLDRQLAGRAPLAIPNLSPGTHQINVQAEGFEGVAQTVEVTPGGKDIDVTLRLREVRLDVSLSVVHKHRLGSCMGRLVATPRGVRYETTDADDAFEATLADLETFQVDYLQKNLRSKPRGRKQYDFTDPEGNADRLFVFHRDVTKARDRLAKGDIPAGE